VGAWLGAAVAEQHRWMHGAWGNIEVGLAIALLLVLLFGSNESKAGLFLAFGMMLIAVLQRFAFLPEITVLERLAASGASGLESGDRARRLILDYLDGAITGVKWVLGFALAVRLMLRHQHTSHHPSGATTDEMAEIAR
jgi:hypothetical protein